MACGRELEVKVDKTDDNIKHQVKSKRNRIQTVKLKAERRKLT